MNRPIDHLRSADPAADLGSHPDERAEADLRLLLAEPKSPPPQGAGRSPRRFVPLIVTGLVAVVVIVGTLAVFGAVHPRVDVGGSTAPTLGTSTVPTLGTSACHPAEVLPFQCGTYESTYGGRAITGDDGGPAKDRLRISFTPQDGALLLTASTINCFAERVLVRFDGKRLIRIGAPEYSQNDCFGHGTDTKSWAYAFLNGPLTMNGPEDFGSGDSVVFFEYQGTAAIGERQLPRNDLRCVAPDVQPFSCATYRSTAGTGALAFLAAQPTTLGFDHLNGELTVSLSGWCNSLDSDVAVDGSTLVSYGVGGTQKGCGLLVDGGPDERQLHDDAWTAFFTGVLTYRITGDTVTFTKGASSATFQR